MWKYHKKIVCCINLLYCVNDLISSWLLLLSRSGSAASVYVVVVHNTHIRNIFFFVICDTQSFSLENLEHLSGRSYLLFKSPKGLASIQNIRTGNYKKWVFIDNQDIISLYFISTHRE